MRRVRYLRRRYHSFFVIAKCACCRQERQLAEFATKGMALAFLQNFKPTKRMTVRLSRVPAY